MEFTSLQNIKQISLLKDKDKLIIVGYVYIKDLPKQRSIIIINTVKKYLEASFDETVKVLVMPVLSEEKQGIEVLNPVFADNNLLKELNEKYKELIKNLDDINNK